MKIRINAVTSPEMYEQVSSNIIYNRFDLFLKPDEFGAAVIRNGKEQKVVEYRIDGRTVELGLWLTPITVEELEHLIHFIHLRHPDVEKIIFKNAAIPYGTAKAHNYFRIIFPETVEEMKARVSPKSWSKMRRRNRRAAEVYGEMRLEEYVGNDIPLEVVETFFQFKKETRGRVYNMTAKEYLERYHVTHCYVVSFGNTVGAMHFCCEQCPIVYGENHSYNPELMEYSLGRFIFAHSLVRMVENHHTEIYLAGGDYEYKTHYGSLEETVYDCTVMVKDLEYSTLSDWDRFYLNWQYKLSCLTNK